MSKTTPPTPAYNKTVVEVLQEAWLNNHITFTRSNNYEKSKKEKQIASLGEIFYLIDYKTDTHIVYQGAYKMSTATETKLITQEKLNSFLIHQLSKELE